MKVLFVSSGNSYFGISPIVKNQFISIRNQGVNVESFLIKGKGMFGYLSNLKRLYIKIKEYNPDIIHAHYSLSGYLASFFFRYPIVVSLMGSDIKANKNKKLLIRFFAKYIWSATIVKSNELRLITGIDKIKTIPNGVDLELFKPYEKSYCRNKLKWDSSKTNILFLADPKRKEKNFLLAYDSIKTLKNEDIELKVVYNVPSLEIPIYINAADIIVLSSLYEGSPNVIKESMACNKVIVSTKVGDVEWLFGKIDGLFLSEISVHDFSNKILKAISFINSKKEVKGRERIIQLGLDSHTIAKKIVLIYQEILS